MKSAPAQPLQARRTALGDDRTPPSPRATIVQMKLNNVVVARIEAAAPVAQRTGTAFHRLIEKLPAILQFVPFRALLKPLQKSERRSPKCFQVPSCVAHVVNHSQGRDEWRSEKLVMRSVK